jgi:cytochrome c1
MKYIVTTYLCHDESRTRWLKAEHPYHFLPFDPTTSGMNKDTILVKEMQLEVEVPDDFDPTPEKVKRLEEIRAMVVAEFSGKLKNIDIELSKLQAISYGGSSNE